MTAFLRRKDHLITTPPWKDPGDGILHDGSSSSPSSSSPHVNTGEGGWRRMVISAVGSHWVGSALKLTLGATVVLYVLNQKHMLPKPLSAVVSKTLFWPTLPITYSRRLNSWITPIDDTIVLGGAPIGWARYPEQLYKEYAVCAFTITCLCQVLFFPKNDLILFCLFRCEPS
jgi:hypothetical protein